MMLFTNPMIGIGDQESRSISNPIIEVEDLEDLTVTKNELMLEMKLEMGLQ